MNKSNRKVADQFKYYVFLTVLYSIFMITAQALTYRVIKIGPFLEPGGIFVFPATFAITDIIAEVYGPTLARKSIFISLIAQAFYSLMPMIINTFPHPENWQHADAFKWVFGLSWLIFLSYVIAILVGMLLNTQIIGKTKIITGGKLFSIRSLFSSAIGELVSTIIIVSIAMVPIFGLHTSIKLFFNIFLFKLGFSILMLYPASVLVVLFKKLDNVDVYEESISFNPFAKFMRANVTVNANNILNLDTARNKK